VRRWTAGTPTAAIDGERLGGRRVGEGEEAGDGRGVSGRRIDGEGGRARGGEGGAGDGDTGGGAGKKGGAAGWR
jgi:hypothetical protein